MALLSPRDLGLLPDEVSRPLRGLLGLSRLRLALGDKGSSPPDVKQIEQDLADLGAATGDAELAEKVRRDLETKYAREKDTRRAEALRDMKKTLFGPEANSIAVQRSPDGTPSTTDPGASGSDTAPSHGLSVPPGPTKGIPPVVRGTPLPPLETTTPQQDKTAAHPQDKQSRSPAPKTSTPVPTTRRRDARKPANASRDLEDESRQLLIRVVNAWEWERGRTPLVRVIPGLGQSQVGNPLCEEGEDDKEFIKKVERLLGPPPLSNAERCLAVAMRKRNIAEVRAVVALRKIRAQTVSR